MRLVIVLVALLSSIAAAQVREGETKERMEARVLLLEIYQRDDVREACRKLPDGFITVIHREREFSVNCATRREYLELFDHMP